MLVYHQFLEKLIFPSASTNWLMLACYTLTKMGIVVNDAPAKHQHVANAPVCMVMCKLLFVFCSSTPVSHNGRLMLGDILCGCQTCFNKRTQHAKVSSSRVFVIKRRICFLLIYTHVSERRRTTR